MIKTFLTLPLLLAGSSSLRLLAAEWPQYRGPLGNGSSPEIIQKVWPANGLRQLWKIPTPGGFSSFAIAGGHAYTLVLRTVDGVKSEVCLALDASSGKELWAANVGVAKYDGGGDSGASDNKGGDGPRSTPAADGGRVYVLSASQVLHCFDAESGKSIWRRELSKENRARNISWQSAASPVIDGNLIFVCAGGPDQSLLALHKNTGLPVWKGESDQMTHASPVVADILGTRQVIFLTQSGLVSAEVASGKILWRQAFPYRTSTAASPVVGDNIVYCSAGYGVGAGAFQISKNGTQWTATEKWRTPGKLMNHWSSAVYHQGHIYGLFGFKDYGTVPLKCIELETGRESWSKGGFGQGGTILVDGLILILTENGELVLVAASPKAFTEMARAKAVSGKCWNHPVVADGRIYARSTIEGVCFDVSATASAR